MGKDVEARFKFIMERAAQADLESLSAVLLSPRSGERPGEGRRVVVSLLLWPAGMRLATSVMLVVLAGPGVAQAADEPAVTELAAALAIPALQRVGRVAIVAAGPDTVEATRFRTVVATAFARTGHQIAWAREPLATPEPDAALLSKLWTDQHASGVAVVRFSTPFERSRGSVVLYDVGGAPLFKAFAGRPDTDAAAGPLWTSWPIVDPHKLPGPALYQEIGRDDLARSYRRRKLGKTLSRVGGGVLVAAWIGFESLKLASTIDTDTKTEVTNLEKVWLAGGVAMLIVPSFIRTDPLTDDERDALVGRGPNVTLGAAPLPGGGTFSVAGRF